MLTPEAKAILQLLVNFIREGRFLPHDEQSFIGYKEAHNLLSIQRQGPHWGHSLRMQGLEDLAKWLLESDLPAITGLIQEPNEEARRVADEFLERAFRTTRGAFIYINNRLEGFAPGTIAEIIRRLVEMGRKYILIT